MPVIPFSTSRGVSRAADIITEQAEEEEAKRYREASDAKLDELMKQKVKRFDHLGGKPMIDVPEPVTGGWKVRDSAVVEADPYRISDADAQASGLDMPMGAGGPENPADPAVMAIINRRKAAQSANLRASLMQSTSTPDQAAADIDTAQRLGVERLEVETNRKAFDVARVSEEINKLSDRAPFTYSWLNRSFDHLEVAHDDIENLSWWEQAGQFFSPGSLTLDEMGKALATGFADRLPQQLAGLDKMAADTNAAIYRSLPDWFPYKAELVRGQVERSNEAWSSALIANERVKANASQGETWIERGIYSAMESAPSTVVALLAGVVTRNPAVATSGLGGMTAGGAYVDAQEEGLADGSGVRSLEDRLRYALTQGGIETATEMLPMKFLLDDLAKDTPLFKTFFRQAAAEGISEQAATFLQDASTWLEMNPDKTLGEFLAERPNAALETLVASTVMSGVQTTIAQGMQAAGDKIDQTAQQKRAEQLAKTFDAMAQNAKDSKLAQRLPEKYRQLVNEVTKNGPLESVRIAPEAITSLAQEKGVSVEQLAQAFRIDPNELVTAIDTGEDVVIPAGNYAAGLSTAKKEIGVSGETIHAGLAKDMRLRAHDFTARESEAARTAFEAEAKAREERRATDEAFADSGDRVRNTIREQITSTGVFNADAANTQAELIGAMVETLAINTQADPEALWKERGFDIVASLKGEEADAVSLAQTAINELANPPGFVTGKDKAGKRRTFSPRDIVLGYNDGDTSLDMMLDFDVEGENATRNLNLLSSNVRRSVRTAMAEGQLERLAETWGVTPDELQAFAKPRWGAGAFEDLMADVVDIVERDNRLGQAPGLEQVVQRLAARGHATTANALKVRLSNARTGKGDGALSEAMRERVRGLQFARGRGAAQGKALAQSGSRDLPMDETSRMQRAREQGFDVDTPLYHGTDKSFDEFSANPRNRNDTGHYGKGTYFSTQPGEANYFAEWSPGADAPSPTARVIKAYARGKLFDVTDGGDVTQIVPDFLESVKGLKGLPKQIEELSKLWDDAVAKVNVEQIRVQMDPYSRRMNHSIPDEMIDADGVATVWTDADSAAAIYYPSKKDAVADLAYRQLSRDGVRFPMTVAAAIQRNIGADEFSKLLKQNGYDGVRAGDEVVIFDPANIRSVDAAFDPSETQSSKLLAQDARGTFTPRADRNVVRLFEGANLSTLAHEASHWYLDTLWRMNQAVEPHPFVQSQLAAILEWRGKSPNWTGMFNPDGSFTKEGAEVQEAFAESFELYLREGKAPTTALRSVFASFKQWLLSLYKNIRGMWVMRDPKTGAYTMRANLDRANLNDEIRQVFDRMLATDEAIKAVHVGIARDGEAMAQAILKAQDPDGKWKPERKEKFLERMRERYAAARERAEAALMARLMDEYHRTKQAGWRDEERDVRREVQSEIDERPEQRAYAWLSGKGWKDTREARVEEAFTEAEAMRALAQAPELGFFDANATTESIQALQAKMVENGIVPIVLLFRTTSGRIIAFPGDSGSFGMHHDMAREVFGLGDLKLQHGVWNPRKWPTIEAMNAADTAWYDTTGTAEDVEARTVELAQRTKAADQHSKDVKRVVEFLQANPALADGPLANIMLETQAPAYAADRGRRLYRAGGSLAQAGDGLLVYRGSAEDEEGVTENGRLGLGFYSAEDPEIGGEWGGMTGRVDAWRIKGRLFDLDAETAEGLENYEKQEDTPAAQKLFARLKSEGYVGVRDPWSGHINVFDPKDMQRVPAHDTELGKTWTNFVEDLDEDSPSLAQSVQPSRKLDAMGFYSALREAVANSKQNKASAEQWKATLSKLPGVKAEEIDWTGVNDWLDAQEGQVTREALEAYLVANGVKIEEVIKGERGTPRFLNTYGSDSQMARIVSRAAQNLVSAENARDALIDILANESDFYDRMKRIYSELFAEVDGDSYALAADVVEALDPTWLSTAAQFETYTLSGGTNYTELLLTLPAVKGPATHWEEPNVVAHARFKERRGPNGERVLALEEIQSDWHQKGRGQGYQTPVDPAKVEQAKAARDKALTDFVPARDAVLNWFAELEREDLGVVMDEMWGSALSAARREEYIETIYATADLRDMSEHFIATLRQQLPDTLKRLQNGVLTDAPFKGKPGLSKVLSDYDRAALAANEANQAYLNATYPGGIPNAPFKNNGWVNLVLKRMIRYAAENNFATLAWIPGSVQNGGEVETDDNRADFYDKIVPAAANKLGRKYGAEVVLAKAPEMSGSTNTGRYAAVEDEAGNGWLVVDTTRNDRVMSRHDTEEEATTAATGSNRTKGTPGVQWHSLPITPQLKAAAIEGFPLFQTGGKDRIAPPTDLPPMRLNLQAVREQYGDQALAEIPPEVAAYSAQASDVDQFLDLARDVRRSLAKPKPKSLWKFLSTQRRIGQGNDRISYRGIRDDGGELLKIVGEKKAAPGLINDGEDGKRVRSYSIEHAAEAAWEAGYFNGPSPPTPDVFLDALRADFDGQAPLYARNDMPALQERENAERWAEWFDLNDIYIHGRDSAVLREQLATLLSAQGENAIGPDEAAEFFKMPDGAALLEGLKQGPLREKLIRDETRRRMIERNGDVFRDGTILQEAEAYARNELQHRQWEIELEALAEAGGQRIATNALKQQAIENLRTKQVREVLNYQQWLILERRWAQKAIKEKDPAKAAEYAKYRLLNSLMYSEGKKLAEKIEKARKHLLSYGDKTKQARLFKAGKEYQETMNGLLDDYQFRNESKKAENQRAARAAWIKAQMAAIDPYSAYQDTTKSAAEQQAEAAEALEKSRVLAEMGQGLEAKGYKSLTVEELLAVRDEADMIWKMATLADHLLKAGERRRLTLAAQDVAAEIETNQPNAKPPEPVETDAPGEGVKRSVLKYFAMHRTLQSLARQFAGGKDGGKFWSYVVKPLNEAFAKLSTLRKQMGEDMKDLFSTYSEAEQKRMFRERRTFDFRAQGGPRITLSKQGRLAFALNWGNAKNRQRLMDSLGLDEAMVGQVLNTLDKRDWDFVQKTWDYLDTWFPEANRVHEAVHGAPMDKEAPLEIATPFGIYRGGYYPIKFDPMLSSKAGQRQVMEDVKPATGQLGAYQPGFAKARSKGRITLPLRLSVVDVISSHLDQVARSIATDEALFDAGRIVKQPEVEKAIVSRHGREVYNTIINTLITAKFGLEGASGLLAWLRNGATVVGLGWKVSTALLQPLGISNSIVRVGGYWIAKGYARMGKDAATVQSSANWIMQRSEFMRNRRQANSPEMAALRKQVKAGVVDLRIPGLGLSAKAFDAIKDNAFALMANVQFYSVDMPTWFGAYYKARAAGMNEGDAVASADQAVIDSQGGGELHQTSAMQTGAGTRYAAALRLLTNFMSYMITTYNLTVQRTRNARTPAQIAALALDYVILLSVPVAGKMMIDAWTKGDGDDEDEENPLWERYGREQLAFIFSPFVGVSQIAGTARGEEAFGYRGPAGLGIFAEATNAGRAAFEADFDESFWRPANRAAGMIFHYPAGQIDASIRGAAAYFNGETDNPAAFLVGPPPAN
jgi:hypothetical protein